MEEHREETAEIKNAGEVDVEKGDKRAQSRKDDDDKDKEGEGYQPEPDNSGGSYADCVMHEADHLLASSNHLSKIQKEAVDQAFERLFGYPWGTVFDLPPVLNHQQRMLVRVFGPEVAATIVQASRTTKSKRRSQERLNKAASAAKPQVTGKSEPNSEPMCLPPLESGVTGVTKKSEQGDETVRSQEMAGVPPLDSAQCGAPGAPRRCGGGGGVDRLLSEIAGKSTVTTISKTSADWESFKSASGLGTKIEEKAQSKDAFLNRQDFLTRVDNRKFEVEKKERDRERAKRGT